MGMEKSTEAIEGASNMRDEGWHRHLLGLPTSIPRRELSGAVPPAFFRENSGPGATRPIQPMKFPTMEKSAGQIGSGANVASGRFPGGGVSNTTTGAYRFRPDGKRFRLRVVVGRLATLKVDQASIAEARFSLAA